MPVGKYIFRFIPLNSKTLVVLRLKKAVDLKCSAECIEKINNNDT